MGKLVTDPETLAFLNGTAPQTNNGKLVTDPAILEFLNASDGNGLSVAPVAEIPAPHDPNAPSELGSFGRGVVHGGMANFDDELGGAAYAAGSALQKGQRAVKNAVIDVVQGKVPSPLRDAWARYARTFQDANDKGTIPAISSLSKDVFSGIGEGTKALGNDYATGRDYIRGWQKKDEATNPYAYMGGQIVGGVGSMAIPGVGVGGKIASGVTNAAMRGAAARAAAQMPERVGIRGLENIGNAGRAIEASSKAAPTFFQKLLGNAAEGAAIGGLYGAGSGEGLEDTALSAGLGSMIGGGAGAAIPSAMNIAGKAVGLPGNMIRKSLAGKNASEIAQAAKEEGVDLTAGMVGNRLMQVSEGSTGMMPGGTNTIAKARENITSQLGNKFEDITGRYGSAVGKEEGGASLQAGGQKWLEASRQQAERAYNKLDNIVPKDTPAELPNTTAYLTEIANKFGGNVEFQKVLEAPVIGQYRKLLVNGEPITYELLKNLRSEIGKKISVPTLTPDDNRAALEGLYESLSSDMEGAASKVPGGLEAFKTANDLWRNRSEQIKGIYNKVLGQDSPEKVFNAALSGSRDGGTKLRQLKAVVGDEAWGDFVGANLRNMGTKLDGNDIATFDPFKFISQMKQFSPEARQALFGAKGTQLYRSLENLEKLSGAFTRSVSAGANSSGTAKAGANMAGIAGMGGAMGSGSLKTLGFTLSGLYAVPFAASKLMTNQKFVQWLSRSAIRPGNKEGFAPHLARLEIIRRNSDPDTAKAIDEYRSVLSDSLPER